MNDVLHAVSPHAPRIGTLREGALHADLRAWFRRPGDRLEVPVDGYVIDLERDGLLVEFQTGSFSPLRRKLPALLARHRVHVVMPVAAHRYILRVDETGELLGQRRSPKRGRIEDVFAQLVSIPQLLDHPRFSLEAVLVEVEEVRVHRPGRAFRRRGWIVRARALRRVLSSHILASASDAAALLPPRLPDPFGTADLTEATGMPRRLAQQMVYCLVALGAVAHVGKHGRAPVYRCTGAAPGE